jgi:hypothetical protein
MVDPSHDIAAALSKPLAPPPGAAEHIDHAHGYPLSGTTDYLISKKPLVLVSLPQYFPTIKVG